MPRRRTYRRKKNALIASLGPPPPPPHRQTSSSSSSSSERSEPATMQIGVTAFGTAAPNNTNTTRLSSTGWAYGKGIKRKMRSAAYKSRKRNRRRH